MSICCIDGQQLRARRIGAASLIAVRIGAVDQGLIGEIELRRPVDGGAASELIPLLVHHAGNGIAIPGHEQFARDVREMLLILGPAQAGRELQIAEDVVIRLAETRIGVQRVGILAQKVIVSLVVEAG